MPISTCRVQRSCLRGFRHILEELGICDDAMIKCLGVEARRVSASYREEIVHRKRPTVSKAD
jgi:hypothetical protein